MIIFSLHEPELTVGDEFEFLVGLTKFLSPSRKETGDLKAFESPQREMVLGVGQFVCGHLQQTGSEYSLFIFSSDLSPQTLL